MTDDQTDELSARREGRVPEPDGESLITMFMDDDRIIFRDQQALDDYVNGVPCPDFLTEVERGAIKAAGELWGDLCAIVGNGPTRDADLAELIVHVHAIQHTVMAQAAARAYPGEFRLLGEVLKP